MQLTEWIELFAMVTGVLYVLLEILQKNAMWVVGIATGAACAYSFSIQHSWGMVGLNLYYVVMSVVGLIRWTKDSAAVEEGQIHLRPLSRKTALWSVLLYLVGSLVLIWLFRRFGDKAPVLDALATMLSVIATWWLAESHLQQWLLWIVADVLTTVLCLVTDQYWLSVLYLAYVFSAVYGYYHWKKNGIVVNLRYNNTADQ